MENNPITFIQQNSSDGGFLQSPEWRRFQESVGRKTHNLTSSALRAPSPYQGEGSVDFYANIIEHTLPLVGNYFYIPRGPIINLQFTINKKLSIYKDQFSKLINLARENNAGWIRIEPATDEILEAIRSNTKNKIIKAPHDMQPKELFVVDITKPEEQLMAEMKSKTRYNIRLAEKKEVRIKKQEVSGEYVDEFMRLTEVMAKRQGIQAHPASYYRKMMEIIPSDILKLYVAEYENKIIAANIVVFYGHTATYLHGASDDQYRNVMAPYLLQWRQIRDAKEAGCERYDFGGVKIGRKKKEEKSKKNSWEGITRFKLGFSPETAPTEFPGSYDIIISPVRYWMYRSIQKVKSLIR